MKTQERLLYIIERVSKEACSTKQLTQEIFETTDKNQQRLIQMDIRLLKNHFKDKIVTVSKKHKFIKLPYFMHNLTTTDGIKMKELIEFLMVFDNKMLSLFEKEEPLLIQNLRDEIKSIYLIYEPPLEIINPTFLDEIKRAIRNRQYVTLEYKSNLKESYIEIQLHRIIYAEGNWYLAIHDHTWEKKYNLLRINFIKRLELHSKTFHRDIEIEKAIDNFQSLFSKPNANNFEVILRVSYKKMRYFQNKKHLKSQKIIEESKKGLTLSYQVTDAMEIIPLIKKWMPYIVVISPKSVQEALCRDAEAFLKKQQGIMNDTKTL
jgi:predicted DNA-binding transcriptional regulator YafY